MKGRHSVLFAFIVAMLMAMGCQSASQQANATADQAMYKPVNYANANKPGPDLVVIPGEIKSANAAFSQKVGANNIADYAELELSKANFKVLERTDLGPMLEELALAVNMGDAKALQKFKKGKFQTTKWFIRFDILKAEPVAQVQKGFDGRPLGAVLGGILGATGHGAAGYATDAAVGSVQTQEAAGVWIIGMRYKILDANTSEQVATNYFEDKMEIGSKSTSVMGISQGEQKGVTLDTMTQRLVQMAVQDIDSKK